MNKKISIIILNYQSYEDTIKYIKNLKKQKEVILNILVVDNCSPNNSYEILYKEFINDDIVTVIKSEKNGGYAYGNNFGLKYLENSNSNYILISNNDIIIENNLLLKELANKFEQLSNPAIISPSMKTNNKISEYAAWKTPTLFDDIVGSLRSTDYFFKKRLLYTLDGRVDLYVDCLPGSFLFTSKKVMFDINLFDENTFLYGEEVILSKKIKDAGLRNYLIQSLSYEHTVSGTISKTFNLFKMRKYLIQSRKYYHLKYFNKNKYQVFILDILYQLWKLETIILKTIKGKR